MKVASVIPALNEEERIGSVLDAVTRASLVDEVLVVSDGSTDGTYSCALRHEGVKAIELAANVGKAGAMWAGATRVDADLLVFLDADLRGLKPAHVDTLAESVLNGSADMSVGLFRQGRFLTDLAQKIAPVISGQRAIRKEHFLSIPGFQMVRMGAEVALTQWARANSITVATVELDGVSHIMKEEKLGAVRGFVSRMHMYWDIGRVMMDGRSIKTNQASRSRAPVEE